MNKNIDKLEIYTLSIIFTLAYIINYIVSGIIGIFVVSIFIIGVLYGWWIKNADRHNWR
jgi:hypothetical protein